jgi:hypothetical protein
VRALASWKAVTADRVDFLGQLVGVLTERNIRCCVAGGRAVNAYADSVVSLDRVIAVD